MSVKVNIGTVCIYMTSEKLAKKLCREMFWQTNDLFINDRPIAAISKKHEPKHIYGSNQTPIDDDTIRLVMNLGSKLYSINERIC